MQVASRGPQHNRHVPDAQRLAFYDLLVGLFAAVINILDPDGGDVRHVALAAFLRKQRVGGQIAVVLFFRPADGDGGVADEPGFIDITSHLYVGLGHHLGSEQDDNCFPQICVFQTLSHKSM